jgi:hypothetical protein
VNSWIGALKRDKNEIFRAAHDASKATDFILTLERDRSIGEEDLASGPVLASRASGSSPAASLEQETEELHHDRERVEEKELDAATSADDPAISQSTDNANEHTAPVRESTDYAARYEPGSGTVDIHAKQSAAHRPATRSRRPSRSQRRFSEIPPKRSLLRPKAAAIAAQSLVRRNITSSSASPPARALRTRRICSIDSLRRAKTCVSTIPIPKASSANFASVPKQTA